MALHRTTSTNFKVKRELDTSKISHPFVWILCGYKGEKLDEGASKNTFYTTPKRLGLGVVSIAVA